MRRAIYDYGRVSGSTKGQCRQRGIGKMGCTTAFINMMIVMMKSSLLQWSVAL